MALTLTDDNFDELVLRSQTPVLVDFWAEWCGSCQMLNFVIEPLCKAYQGKVTIAKLDVEQNPLTAKKYGIRHIPVVLIFKDGKVVDEHTGAVPQCYLTEKLDKQLAV